MGTGSRAGSAETGKMVLGGKSRGKRHKAAPHPSPWSPRCQNQDPHPGLRHSWMSDTQAFTCRASAVSRIYSEEPSTYDRDNRRPTGHFQFLRP